MRPLVPGVYSPPAGFAVGLCPPAGFAAGLCLPAGLAAGLRPADGSVNRSGINGLVFTQGCTLKGAACDEQFGGG
jgi:hypothetical protein